MIEMRAMRTVVLLAGLLPLLGSCHKEFGRNDYRAYFGGEVVNPQNRYVLFCKDGDVLDTIPLKANNTFFIAFDSLTPGLYSFRHDPEYQYVYFDKNDSLMVRVNSRDFDQSVVWCGRGDQKNNFLMEQYLRNEADKDSLFENFDLGLADFTKRIDASHNSDEKFYEKKKEKIKWSDGFDKYAKAAMDYHYYAKKEIYPNVHRLRTGNDVIEQLPKDFYDYRQHLDLNDSLLSGFSPYVNYLTHMINNMSSITYHNHFSQEDLALKTNLNKLQVADSLIKNEKVRNIVLNNIAFSYLLEDQRMENNQKFLDMFHKFSTDDIRKNEITKIGNAIQLLKPGNHLPVVNLTDASGNDISSDSFTGKPTVIFFWTEKLSSHFFAVHQKAVDMMKKHPELRFVAINVDMNKDKWVENLAKLKATGIAEYSTRDFQDLRNRWAITKIHRTIILDKDGRIKNAFTNLFDSEFEKELNEPAHVGLISMK
ncbi:TlpA family protein disulfide reductase [Flavobacterium silvaticum]|uniref:Thioredoxin domain-containing protein n=1 Tax=Flavobacterium silvaticum TaxID=1852020 RepID=A0A972FN82_9FLAO|nr:thioredoxin-like domain-containing protein [Flavobacterium silvaticum]NMH28802.1 hypothetical protein [Flavobacterium silvaticum]